MAACVRARVFGAGVTPHARNGGCRGGGGEERGGTALLRCPGCHGAEWRGVEQRGGGRSLVLAPFSDVYFCPLLLHGFIPAQAAQQLTQMTRKKMLKACFLKKEKKNAFNSSILRPESVGPH